MNIEQERTDFEAWYQHPHGDRDVYTLDESGEYADKQVQGAFNVWIARACLQGSLDIFQDREDVLRYRYLLAKLQQAHAWATSSLADLASTAGCRTGTRATGQL